MRKILLPVLLLSSSLATAGGAGQPAGGVPTLRLTAPIGTAVTYQATSTTNIKISSLTVAPRPGADVDQETLKMAHALFMAGLRQGVEEARSETEQITHRVLGRDAAGNVTLQTTRVLNDSATGDTTLRITTRLSPDGQRRQVTAVKLESPDPELQAAFDKFSPEQRNTLAEQKGGVGLPTTYGAPLVVGQTRTTETARSKDLIGGLASDITGTDELKFDDPLFRSVETLTYSGLNAQGLYAFTSNERMDPVSVSAASEELGETITLEVPLATNQSQQLYRRDGLPASWVSTTTAQMRLTMPVKDLVLTVVVDMQEKETLRQK